MNAPQTLSHARRYPITADMFEGMFNAGLFRDQRRLELLDGELVEMSPVHIPHAGVTAELLRAVGNGLKARRLPLRVLSEPSVRANDYNVPQPDIVVWDPTTDEGFAPRESVRLAVEVADSTLADDLGPKCALYAAAGIPEYWVADVRGRTIRLHSVPAGGAYANVSSARFGEQVASLTIPGLTVDTSDL